MKSYITLALLIAVTSISTVSSAAGAPKFCMKKFLASQRIHANSKTNFYASVQKTPNSLYKHLESSGVIKRNR
ncbi:MAG: hypothetical protein A2622_06065 [Bdellovibrionales bacterium RIFCSPHIGHO2_01_FULL_40_29]|nr:MAG: hypothetical protein A2622_06065 [Bdellovibrionales bacterium RIFCSPHIGHO2_01_FULL_40_29]OFZ35015.1 MAG: hypothetical protein A3D17_06415 [Bdellovibrionales bacterium RIFCSPHIGHO2_02_FULL_40_15]